MEKIFDKNSVLARRGKNISPADGECAATAAAFCRLFELIRILRSPEGCPWDKEQTPLSMRRDLIEEAFEAVDAINAGDAAHAKEELGDVLLNAAMISYMYAQAKDEGKDGFSLSEMFDELAEKLIRRHPHVFPQSEGNACVQGEVKTGGEVLAQWDRIKENIEGRARDSILDEVPEGFPPLLRAFKMQKKAAKKGFDWTSLPPARAKILEELAELDNAAALVQKEKAACQCALGEGAVKKAEAFTKTSSPELDEAQKHLEEECGDLLFAVVNYARKMGADPVVALNITNKKFHDRFAFVEKKCAEQGVAMVQENLDKMDAFWEEAKRNAGIS